MTSIGGTADAATSQQAFEGTYIATYRQLLALAIATAGDRALAEDAVQDAYAQLWRRWDSVEHPIMWLRRAVTSNCLDAMRTQRRRSGILGRQARIEQNLTSPPPENDFLDLLDGLNERQRAVVVLKYVCDLSERDIAQSLGCRLGTVKSSLNRAMRVLRERAESEQP